MESTAVRASKLLREMEAEAWKQVKYVIENGVESKNKILFSGFVFANSPLSPLYQWYIKMEVNGTVFDLKGDFDKVGMFSDGEVAKKLIESIHTAIKDELAKEIIPILKKTLNV